MLKNNSTEFVSSTLSFNEFCSFEAKKHPDFLCHKSEGFDLDLLYFHQLPSTQNWLYDQFISYKSWIMSLTERELTESLLKQYQVIIEELNVTSTHEKAHDKAHEFGKHPSAIFPRSLVVLAHHQSAGIGRRNNHWLSDPVCSLTFSFIIKKAQPITLTPLELGYVLAEFLEKIYNQNAHLADYWGTNQLADPPEINQEFVVNVESPKRIFLKWPNDLINEKNEKLAGIICQGLTEQIVLAGIGINLFSNKFSQIDSLNIKEELQYSSLYGAFRDSVHNSFKELLENELKDQNEALLQIKKWKIYFVLQLMKILEKRDDHPKIILNWEKKSLYLNQLIYFYSSTENETKFNDTLDKKNCGYFRGIGPLGQAYIYDQLEGGKLVKELFHESMRLVKFDN